MWLPTKLYESLPVLYFMSGVSFLLGAFYIGVGHGFTPAYLALGSACMIAGVQTSSVRREARSAEEAL